MKGRGTRKESIVAWKEGNREKKLGRGTRKESMVARKAGNREKKLGREARQEGKERNECIGAHLQYDGRHQLSLLMRPVRPPKRPGVSVPTYDGRHQFGLLRRPVRPPKRPSVLVPTYD